MPTLLESLTNSITQNPYPELNTYYSDGLDYIIANIGGTPDVDALVSTVLAYINSLSWFSSTPASLPIEISSVAYSAINSYLNGQVGAMYSGTQRTFVNDLIGPNFIDNTVDSIPSILFNIQDIIPKRRMSVEAQTPLFFATAIGQSANVYWINQIGLGGSSAWNTYLSAALTSATANVPFYVAAGMEGALIGAGSPPTTMIAPTTSVVSNKIISSLIAALTIGAGKVIFNWVPRVNLDLNSSIVSKMTNEEIYTGNIVRDGIYKTLKNNNYIASRYSEEDLMQAANTVFKHVNSKPTEFLINAPRGGWTAYWKRCDDCFANKVDDMGIFEWGVCLAGGPDSLAACVLAMYGDCMISEWDTISYSNPNTSSTIPTGVR